MKTKVLGVGLGKTGTTSLGRALEILGYRTHAKYNLEALKLYKKGNIKELMKIVKVYDCLEDYPWLFLYAEVLNEFPDSKFILTKRKSEEDWFKSLCAHAERSGPTHGQKLIFGHYMPHHFKSEHISFYLNHNHSVMEFFKLNAPDKLLVLEIPSKKLWNPLCDFLEKKVPNQPYPKLNMNHLRKNNYPLLSRLKSKFLGKN